MRICKDGRIWGQNNKESGNHLGILTGRTHSKKNYIKKGRNPNSGFQKGNTFGFSGLKKENHPNWVQREVRFCKCGCGYSREVRITSKWKFKRGHWHKGQIGKCSQLSRKGKENGCYGRTKELDPERYEKISKTMRDGRMKGERNTFYNHKHSEETKQKDRIAQLNKKPNWHPKTEKIVSTYLDELKIRQGNRNVEDVSQVDHHLIDYKVAIQDDGCYWHGCEQCFPNKKFLKDKRVRLNMERDKIVNEQLKLKSYRVLRIWEHDIKNGKYKEIINDFIQGGKV